MRKRISNVLLWTACVLALATSDARGELGTPSGIAVDVEVAHVLDEIEAETAKVTRTAQELSQMGTLQSQALGALRTRVRALYRITRPGMAPVAGGFDAVRRHVARVRRLSSLIRNDGAQLRTLVTRNVSLRAQNSLSSAALARARQRLSDLQERKATGGDGGGDGFAQMLAESGAAPRAASGNAFYGLRLADEAPSEGFEALRGSLGAPVAGEVRVVNARRDESDGPGLEFQAPVGTAVRAAAAGRVAFCDRYGSYGKLVILDHGSGYYTAYGGLGAVEVRAGDDLSTRARIGSVGADSNPPALFFEVRKGTRTLPPRAWLGL